MLVFVYEVIPVITFEDMIDDRSFAHILKVAVKWKPEKI